MTPRLAAAIRPIPERLSEHREIEAHLLRETAISDVQPVETQDAWRRRRRRFNRSRGTRLRRLTATATRR
jgi:hypothetical protein